MVPYDEVFGAASIEQRVPGLGGRAHASV